MSQRTSGGASVMAALLLVCVGLAACTDDESGGGDGASGGSNGGQSSGGDGAGGSTDGGHGGASGAAGSGDGGSSGSSGSGNTSGSGGSGDGGSSGSGAGGSGNTSGSGGSGDGGSSGAGAGGSAGSGATCADNGGCAKANYCVFSDGKCGSGDPGHCEPRPLGCPDNVDPACGCDGTVYSNGCDANALGVDLDVSGQCTPPEGKFSCGARYCGSLEQYCLITMSRLPPADYECQELPSACPAPATCVCLKAEGLVCEPPGSCSEFDKGISVTCIVP